MIVAIQQPEHLPWLGFFDKMRSCDGFIFLDNVQFKKRYFENRNKICTEEGWQWITVPVVSKGKYKQKINEVEVDNSVNWQRKYLGSLDQSYGKSKYFDDFYPGIRSIISKSHTFLVDLNIDLINFLKECFKINTQCFLASDLVSSELTGSDIILQLCLKVGAKVYLSGPDGRTYLNLEDFESKGIKVIYHDYKHPEYTQLNSTEFIPYMSSVDYLFNYGVKI